MKKTLNAILCVMLVALMGVAAPLLILFSAKQTDTPAVSDGFDAVYADEEEDDLSGLAADALYTVNADMRAPRALRIPIPATRATPPLTFRFSRPFPTKQ